MRINNTAAFALAGVIALTLAGCGRPFRRPPLRSNRRRQALRNRPWSMASPSRN
ncbi:MAG: hypothetical protein ACLT3D_03390 [Lawsonibacter sp.]